MRIALQLNQRLTGNHKKRRVSFAYWVGKELRKRDHRQIMFTDDKGFSLEGVFNRQNERVDSLHREDADRWAGINQRSTCTRRIMIWSGASKNGLMSLIIFQARWNMIRWTLHQCRFATYTSGRCTTIGYWFSFSASQRYASCSSEIIGLVCRKLFELYR